MPPQIRVLYLTINPNRESTTRPTEYWITSLRSRGLEPVLVTSEPGPFMTWAKAQGIPGYTLPLPFPSKLRPWPFLVAWFRLWRIVRRHRIQLIHCNEHNVYPIGQYLARLCRLPVVVSVHFTVTRAFAAWAFGGARQPDRIFFLSAGNLSECRPAVSGIVAESRWRLLPNVIDLDWFRPDEQRRVLFRRQHQVEAAVVLGNASALRPRKQLEHFFAATARLNDPRVHVVVAGRAMPGDERYAEQLLDNARQLLGDRFHYFGHCSDLREFYNGLDLFINTSQEESFGLSVLEALACGCPVVGYASKCVDELVLPNGGEIVVQDKIDSLATALENWSNDPQRMETTRGTARLQVAERFDPQRIILQLWNDYQELVKAGRDRRDA
ncbi:MAG: glycosyltransferase family 4 protein [Gemmataceae bacterium]